MCIQKHNWRANLALHSYSELSFTNDYSSFVRPSVEIKTTFYSLMTIFQRLTLVWQAELCHGEVNAAR